jgi:hypothetical protein
MNLDLKVMATQNRSVGMTKYYSNMHIDNLFL